MSDIIWHELAMNSDSTPSPYVVTTNSERSGYEAWKAFDGLSSSKQWSPNSPTSGWVMIDFGKEHKFTKLKLKNGSVNANSTPKNIKIEASSDGVTFDVIGVFTLPNIEKEEMWDILEINNNEKSYRFYKIYLLSNYGHNSVNQLGEAVFGMIDYNRLILKNPTTNKHYSLADNTLIHLPDSSPKNMILHGIEKGKEIQLDVPFDKIQYVQDKSEVLGTGRIFKQIVVLNNNIKKITLQ